MNRRAAGYLLVLALALFAPHQYAVSQQSPPPLGIVEKPGNTIPLDVELYDEQGYLTPMSRVINKPTIVTFVYFRCTSICSPLLTELSRMIDQMDLEIGKDYQVVTISFDHHEKPPMNAQKKESYLGILKKPIDPAGWRFFTGDSASIHRLTDAAGFYFKADSNAWIHAGALIVLSSEGKVTRYINGVQYLPFDIKMAVVEASEGRTGPTIAKLVKFCFRYDPEARTYALNVTRVSGLVVLGLAGVFVVVLLVRPKKKTAERQHTHGT